MSDGEERMRHMSLWITRVGAEAHSPCAEPRGRSCRSNLVLRVLLARVVDISFVIHILGVHLDNFATDSSGLRIPTHPITLSECFCHDQTCAACRPLLLARLSPLMRVRGIRV